MVKQDQYLNYKWGIECRQVGVEKDYIATHFKGIPGTN